MMGAIPASAAACTPITHGPLFQDSIREAGLNPYLFEMANIRNQCSWVHAKQREAALPQPPKVPGGLEELTNEQIAAMDPEARARAVLGEDASQEDIDALVKQVLDFLGNAGGVCILQDERPHHTFQDRDDVQLLDDAQDFLVVLR